MSASERQAEKMKSANDNAARSFDDFSKRVQRNIKDLQFQTEQLKRSAAEQQRYEALRRAGVSASSAEGVAITNAVRALQAQREALGHVSLGSRAAAAGAVQLTGALRTMLATLGPIALAFLAVQKVMEAFDKASGLDEAAEQIGVTAKNLQTLQFAAAQSGIKMEQLDTGLTKFSQKMGEAAEGSKEMIEALTRLGVKNLDVNKQLRPTEDLLVDVAKAITNIDDPAKRAAAAVDFFGKAGTRMLPMLAEIAGGLDAMGQRADEAGAIIDDRTVKILDRAADAMARWAQVITAQLAVALARLLTIVEGVALGMTRLADAAGAGMTRLVDSIEVGGAQAVAMFTEAFSALPEVLGTIFTNAWESARVATAKGVNALTALLPSWMGFGGGTNLDTNPNSAGAAGAGLGARITAAGEAAAQAIRDRQQMARQAAMEQDEARARGGPKLGVVGGPITVGASISATKDAGKSAEDAEKKYAKLITTLTQTAAAQDQMTAAAGRGEKSFEAMKVHLEAQQKAFEIYGKVLDDTDPKLKKIEALLLRISQGKAAESFASATNELKNQNEILEKQIELMGQAPEIIAKEIALIKVRQEAEKGGAAITQEAIEARRQAIEQNETLKNQAEELKRAQELWTAPLKSALESIQQTAADAFESMLENGKFSFEELGNVFKKTITRMIAEFLALATVRPVMSVLVNAISPNTAQQMGLGSGNQPSGGGGGMLGNLFGGGSIGNWLSRPISGSTGLPYGQYGPPMQGQGFASWADSLTWGQGLGALAGAGMGAYQLLAGGGSTASTIGGIASLVGAGVSLIPGIGQIAGPIIGLLGGLLPGLFGGAQAPPTNRAITSLNFSGGTFNQSGGSYGMDAADLGGLGTSMKSLLDAAKVKITSSGFGLQQRSFSQGDFSNATTFITGPGGSQMQWGQSSDPAQQQKALDTAAAHVAHQIMLEVGSGISDVMREGLSNFGLQNLQHAFSMEELSTAVGKLNLLDEAFKTFGKTTTDAEAAINAVDESFQQLFDIAEEFNISASEVVKIEAERNRQRLKVTEEFSDGIDQMLMEIKDPLQAALDANEKARTKDLINNDEFVRLVEGYGDKRLQIEELYALRRNEIIEQYNNEAITMQRELAGFALNSVKTIQDLINSLSPGGTLSGLDPRSQLAGLRASADASLAQAMADPSNTSLIDRAVADQRAFIEFNKSFTGGSVDYQSDVQRRIGALQNLQSGVVTAAMNRVSDTVTHSLLSQLLVAVTTDRALVNAVLARLDRYLANPDVADAA